MRNQEAIWSAAASVAQLSLGVRHPLPPPALPSPPLCPPALQAFSPAVQTCCRASRDIFMALHLPAGVRLRPGRPTDGPLLRQQILKEKLNPLGLAPERFVVAERTTEGSTGDSSSRVVGFGQVKPLGGRGDALELASVVVAEDERGKGLGTALVRSLALRAGSTPLYALTVSNTVALYERCGFQEVPRSKWAEVPPMLLFEAIAGTFVAWLAVQQRLVVLRLATGSSSEAQAAAEAAGAARSGT